MNKIKRELSRALMKFALKYPSVFSEQINRKIFRGWNICQRDFAADAYDRGDPAPRPEPPLTLLDLSCTSGFGENVHPDVLYITEGLGKEEWKYFMTCTPLPQGVEYYENPEFLVSSNGTEWSVPAGGVSPLVPPPDDWIGYNSDPSLFFEDGKLTLLYRDFRAFSGYSIVRLLMMNTTDAVSWSRPTVVLSYKRPIKDVAILMSPSFVKIRNCYYMWYVWRSHDGHHRIYRMESNNLGNWRKPILVQIHGLPSDEEPWHPDISLAQDGRLIMALCSFPSDQYRNKRILLCESTDSGLNWNFDGSFIERGAHNFGGKSLYRPSLVLNAPTPKLYYSGQDEKDHWNMVATDIAL